MTDTNFQRLIDKTRKKCEELRHLCNLCDVEYTSRIGVSPSDNQDYDWVTSVHLGEGTESATELMDFAMLLRNNPRT